MDLGKFPWHKNGAEWTFVKPRR
jgi:hypothetical protein